MKRVLVTGFEPFLGSPVNPSREIVLKLSAEPGFGEWFDTLILPVSFSGALRELNRVLAAKPDIGAVLMFGQAGGRRKISLERVALNWLETAKPDEDGFLPAVGPIATEVSPALFSRLPLDMWKEELSPVVPIEVSLTAGGFVCNALYFDQMRTGRIPSLFVHVPYLPAQAKDGEPSLSLEEMLIAARFLLAKFRELAGTREGTG